VQRAQAGWQRHETIFPPEGDAEGHIGAVNCRTVAGNGATTNAQHCCDPVEERRLLHSTHHSACPHSFTPSATA